MANRHARADGLGRGPEVAPRQIPSAARSGLSRRASCLQRRDRDSLAVDRVEVAATASPRSRANPSGKPFQVLVVADARPKFSG